jgi:acyl-lipid omega-6 desaturase (Delta-12 desaturase)
MSERPDQCTPAEPVPVPVDQKAILARYRTSNMAEAVRQVLCSLVPFGLLWMLMWFSLGYSYWLTLLLAFPTAAFMVRLYILHHDCGHGSLVRSQRLNDAVGVALGLLVFTPYQCWRRQHALHHASAGDLDRRGFGDVETLTVREYLQLTPRKRLRYRIYRNPFVLFGIAPVTYFVFLQRLTYGLPQSWKKERANVHWTNLAVVLGILLACWIVGWRSFLLVHVPVVVLASSLGVWLFYIQHNFEGTYWERHGDWEFGSAAMEGSSYYHLPRWLQWLTASIGFHHIHHLDSRIPSYRLEACYAENPVFQDVNRLTLWQSLSCARLKLWDENEMRMVGFPRPE